jgi:hypothetical protein
MTDLSKPLKNAADRATDIFEKVSSPSSRAGAVVDRVGKMLNSGVDEEVIALQMTKNSPNGYPYTTEMVRCLGQLAHDSKSNVVITAKQGRALIDDQQQSLPSEVCGVFRHA